MKTFTHPEDTFSDLKFRTFNTSNVFLLGFFMTLIAGENSLDCFLHLILPFVDSTLFSCKAARPLSAG